jgi:hypothetical protein
VEYEHQSYGFSVTAPTASQVAQIWEQVMRETPSPFAHDWFSAFFGGPRLSYREQLDRQPTNAYGELIPRIVTVRRNLRALGNPRRAPRLPA